jgi:hypothetical protein
MELILEKASAEGVELGQELLEAILFDFFFDQVFDSEEEFLRAVVEDLDASVTEEDRSILVAVVRECVKGNGEAARALAAPLLEKGWEPRTWEVGYVGWVDNHA